MPSACEKTVKTIPGIDAEVAPKKIPVILPKTRLSLWAAILALIGALGLLGYRLVDPISIGSSWEYFTTPAHVLEILQAVSLLTVSILLLTARTNGRSLKIPMLIWAVGTLFMLPSAIYGFIQMLRQYDLLMAYYILLISAIPVVAALFAILYAFKAVKKTPSLIINGILLGAVLVAGTYFTLFALLALIDYSTLPFDTNYIRMGCVLLYYLLYPIGIFLAVLASKKKDA